MIHALSARKKKSSDSEAIPVILASDDNYAVGVATTVYSILKKTRATIHFFVLHNGMSISHMRRIRKSNSMFRNFILEFVDVRPCLLERFPNVDYYGVVAFARYFIPDLFPRLQKVIYTDVDVIFNGDIREYYDIGMDGYGVAASLDEIGADPEMPYSYIYRHDLFHLPLSHKFFSAGNMLIDCAYWREHQIVKQLVDKTIELGSKLVCPDLDVLNIVFMNNYKALDYRYCCCPHHYERLEKKCALRRAFKKPFIIHYATQNKPWKTRNIMFSEKYIRILKKTEYKEFAKYLEGHRRWRVWLSSAIKRIVICAS